MLHGIKWKLKTTKASIITMLTRVLRRGELNRIAGGRARCPHRAAWYSPAEIGAVGTPRPTFGAIPKGLKIFENKCGLFVFL